ncbi:MAG: HypC/HybG/HupF family hydrogenase formation chaperone [Candidatus Korarchaeum sp.]|nr:HypC/HybG/HupF family hydrogenase formation chaperone [Candidatus Korarchaeum sp.]
MCLGIPGRVLEVRGNVALVDFGGVTREVDASLEEVAPGDYVLVHVGMIIAKIDEEEAMEISKLLSEILNY